LTLAAALAASGLAATASTALAAAVPEDGSNDSLATADALTATQSGTGAVSPNGDIDFWARAGATAGNLIFAFASTNASGSSLDSVLTVYNDDGSVLESDDDDGTATSSVVAGAVAAQSGAVAFSVEEKGDNATISAYELFQAVVPAASTAAESEANGSSGTADPMTALVMTGSAANGDSDFFSLTFPAGPIGRRWLVILDKNPDDDEALPAMTLRLLGTDGTTPLRVVPNEATANAAATEAELMPEEGGTFFVEIAGEGGADTDYRFLVLFEETAYFPVTLQSFAVD
jgi:hypothetical protein